MEFGEYIFWKKYRKLGHLRILAPKSFPGSHVQRIWEWRHPLKQSLLDMGESAPERLIGYCMHGRMWEKPHLSSGRGGHLRGTLETWLL